MSLQDSAMSDSVAIGPWRCSPSNRCEFMRVVSICQIFYHQIVGDFTNYVSDKYQHNRDIQHQSAFQELDPDSPQEHSSSSTSDSSVRTRDVRDIAPQAVGWRQASPAEWFCHSNHASRGDVQSHHRWIRIQYDFDPRSGISSDLTSPQIISTA